MNLTILKRYKKHIFTVLLFFIVCFSLFPRVIVEETITIEVIKSEDPTSTTRDLGDRFEITVSQRVQYKETTKRTTYQVLNEEYWEVWDMTNLTKKGTYDSYSEIPSRYKNDVRYEIAHYPLKLGPPKTTTSSREYWETHSKTVTVDGRVSPGDLDALIADAENELDNEIEDYIEDINDSGATYISEVDGELTIILDTSEIEEITNAINNLDENQQTYSSDTGDPVRTATGEFTLKELDASFAYINNKITIERGYLTNRNSSHSFGVGWVFNYDTRLIHGIKPKAQYEVDELGRLLENVNKERVDTKKDYDDAIGDINTLINNLESDKIELEQVVIPNLQAEINKSHPDYVKTELRRRLSRLQAKLVVLSGVITKAYGKKGEIDGAWNTTRPLLDAKIIELEGLKKQAELERDRSIQNHDRNEFVFNSTDPEYYEKTGLDTITWIDESGSPHIFTYEASADYQSPYTYSNGFINYYPSGVFLVSESTTHRLELLDDGNYLLHKIDKSKMYFNFYGGIEKIEDTNGNEICFEYSDVNELINIVDGFTRQIEITRENGIIQAVR